MQVSIRKEGDHYAAFFYVGSELQCFTEAEGHSVASVRYMREKTKPDDGSAEANAMWHRFCGIYHDESLQRVSRLSRP